MEDYSVLEAADAAQCRYMLSNNDVDLVILDIMLPDGDGISLCREIKAKYDIPILFLSALSENDDIITALRAGGDDYLPKPYDIQVLIARVEARLRSVRKDKRYISFGRLRLDTVSMAAYFADNDLLTTQKEFSILLMLARNIGSTVPKAELYENVWGLPYSDNANALFTAGSPLYKKIDDNKTKSGCKCILIANRNIDETKKRQIEYENGLRDALIVAENSAKTRDKFLRNISHEIRTPLNAIIGFTNLSKQNIDDKVKLNNYLQKTEYASKHLLSLINDILDLSKIDSGKLQTKTEKFVLKDAVDELLAAINAQTEEKNIDLKISFDKRLSGLALIGDSLRFKQIMLNILSNAVKFTGKNGKIEFDILRRSEVDNILYISFIITDNGIGMTDEFKDRIFTPFEQQDERISREYGGTGLGMSIVKNLVTLLKGSINIKSKSGSGTSVTVELPFKYENNQTKLSKNDHSENSEKSIAGKNILVTEDNALNREIISELLKSQNANVELAVDGLDAVKKYNNSADNYFDLILMDVQMPNLDGYEATAQIRNSEKPDAVTIPIIAITAHSFESDITKALSSGMNAHISKPINVDDMFKTLHKYI